jgi:hypothetical protein
LAGLKGQSALLVSRYLEVPESFEQERVVKFAKFAKFGPG